MLSVPVFQTHVSIGEGSSDVGRGEAAEIGQGVAEGEQRPREVGREVREVQLGDRGAV